MVSGVPVAEHVIDYARDLARLTRPKDETAPDYVREMGAWGAGPRAGQYLIHAAKALAAIEGEPAPGCGHVRRAAMAVLRPPIHTPLDLQPPKNLPPASLESVIPTGPYPHFWRVRRPT